MAENIIAKDLISLFRGQPMFGQTSNMALIQISEGLSGLIMIPEESFI